MAKVKCPRCGERMDKEGKIYIKGKRRYYHPECIEDIREENKNGTKQKASLSGSTPEQEYQDLVAYICDTYNLKRPNGQILSQIKDYKEKYGYRYKGMELALRYFYDLEGNEVKDNTGVGIIPYIYDRAKSFYAMKLELKNEYVDETPEVRQFKSRSRVSSRGKKQIDLDNL